MVAKSPAWLLGRARAACSLGGCVGRVRHVFVCLSWLVFVGGLGGIATIGAALRRVAGVSGVYGRKTPRVVAQSAVHLGGMGVTWGVWGVVDDGLGALVRGEAFLRGGVSGTSGLSACCWDDRAHCRRLSRGVAREGGASWCVGDVLLCCGRGGAAAYGQVFLRRDRLGIVCSCARVLVCSCARVLVCSLGPSTALSERESRSSLSPTAESGHVGAIHVGRCFLAAAFMRRVVS